MSSPILKYFQSDHLPVRLQSVSRPIGELASTFDSALPDCAEKAAGLRKLLEAKDCFVRARLESCAEAGSNPHPFGSINWHRGNLGLPPKPGGEHVAGPVT